MPLYIDPERLQTFQSWAFETDAGDPATESLAELTCDFDAFNFEALTFPQKFINFVPFMKKHDLEAG
jgi:hypothetical protein